MFALQLAIRSAVVRTGAMAAAMVVIAAPAAGLAQSATTRYPISGEQRHTAEQVATLGVPLAALAPNAPDTYTVKRGDTLWDISSTYYRNPWLFPVIARANDIENPDLIIAGARIFIPEQ